MCGVACCVAQCQLSGVSDQAAPCNTHIHMPLDHSLTSNGQLPTMALCSAYWGGGVLWESQEASSAPCYADAAAMKGRGGKRRAGGQECEKTSGITHTRLNSHGGTSPTHMRGRWLGELGRAGWLVTSAAPRNCVNSGSNNRYDGVRAQPSRVMSQETGAHKASGQTNSHTRKRGVKVLLMERNGSMRRAKHSAPLSRKPCGGADRCGWGHSRGPGPTR